MALPVPFQSGKDATFRLFVNGKETILNPLRGVSKVTFFGPHGNAKPAAGLVEACRANCFSYPLLLLGPPYHCPCPRPAAPRPPWSH